MSNREKLTKWLLENYPTEALLISEITNNVNDIYQHLNTNPNFQYNEPKDIKFQIIKRPETGYTELIMSSQATLFLAGMAKAISDTIIKQILPNIQPETKKCMNCNTINNKIANYCYQCGNKFDSS